MNILENNMRTPGAPLDGKKLPKIYLEFGLNVNFTSGPPGVGWYF